MRKYIVIFSLACLFGCHRMIKEKIKVKNSIYYFYNVKNIFEISEIKNDSLHYLNYEKAIDIYTEPNTIGGDVKAYGLIYYYRFSNIRNSTN